MGRRISRQPGRRVIPSPDSPASLQLSCCAKALTCSEDDDFVGKVRLKFAALIADHHPAEARFEIERVLSHRTRAGYRIPADAKAMFESEWFAATAPKATSRTFYARFTEKAEALLFSHVPWRNASLGDTFTIEGKDGQRPRQRRRIYVQEKSFAIELSVPAAHADVRGLEEGSPLLVQFETSNVEPWRMTIHSIRLRPGETVMDAVPEQIGVIDNINREKSVIHVIVERGVDGVGPIAAYPGDPKVGAFVAVRLVRYRGRNGERTRILSMAPSQRRPPPSVCRRFLEEAEVTEKGFGFTRDDIFIPPYLIAAAGINSGDQVEGVAILSYNDKKNKWGMKAIEARSVTNDRSESDLIAG